MEQVSLITVLVQEKTLRKKKNHTSIINQRKHHTDLHHTSSEIKLIALNK